MDTPRDTLPGPRKVAAHAAVIAARSEVATSRRLGASVLSFESFMVFS
jgi:hypothetical protein